MVNASLNWASIVGIILCVFGFVPFFLKTQIQSRYDRLISLIFWACGAVLFFQGWRLDPVLQFGQFLLASLLAFISYENIKLRKSILNLRSKLKENPFEEDIEFIEENNQKYNDWGTQINNPEKQKERRKSKNKKQRVGFYQRDIGSFKKEDLELMKDKEVYEIVKLHLLGITTGDIKPESGEVEYLKGILNILKLNK